MTIPIIKCLQCIFYISNKHCSVFNKIPDEIWTGEHDHKTKYKGDNGIQFEAIEDE